MSSLTILLIMKVNASNCMNTFTLAYNFASSNYHKTHKFVQKCLPNENKVFSHKYSWVFAVYMAADNNYESIHAYYESNLQKMRKIGSTRDILILVLVDVPQDVWQDVPQRYDGIMIVYHCRFAYIERFDEVNAGNPATLRYFMKMIFNYAANHYALIFYGYAGGWPGTCVDENPNDYLRLNEIKQALSGYHVDLIGFCGSPMANIETAYELRSCADILVASEEACLPDWPFDRILQRLTTKPSMSPKELARTIVDKCSNYEIENKNNRFVYSAIDLTKVNSIAFWINKLATTLRLNLITISSLTFNGYLYRHRSIKHAFYVRSNVFKIETYLYPSQGCNFDLSLWDSRNRRTGGWMQNEPPKRNIPNSQYFQLRDGREIIIVDPVVSAGTWHVGCYSLFGSGKYTIIVRLWYDKYEHLINIILGYVEYFSCSDSDDLIRHGGEFRCLDIYNFAFWICICTRTRERIHYYARRLMNVLSNAIIHERHGNGHPNARGLAVYFPRDPTTFDRNYIKFKLDFVENTQWDEFLLAYYYFLSILLS